MATSTIICGTATTPGGAALHFIRRMSPNSGCAARGTLRVWQRRRHPGFSARRCGSALRRSAPSTPFGFHAAAQREEDNMTAEQIFRLPSVSGTRATLVPREQ